MSGPGWPKQASPVNTTKSSSMAFNGLLKFSLLFIPYPNFAALIYELPTIAYITVNVPTKIAFMHPANKLWTSDLIIKRRRGNLLTCISKIKTRLESKQH